MGYNEQIHNLHLFLWKHTHNGHLAYRTGTLAKQLQLHPRTLTRRIQGLERYGRVKRYKINDTLWVEHAPVSPYILCLQVENPLLFSGWHKTIAKCRYCHTTEHPHMGGGFCSRCFDKVNQPYKPKRKTVERKQRPLTPRQKRLADLDLGTPVVILD